MLDKNNEPSIEDIKKYIGKQGTRLLAGLESYLGAHYDLRKEIRFPFGNSYGWGYKYSHKSKHLCYLFFEDGAITVTVQIGDGEVQKLNEQLESFTPRTRQQWEDRYPCGNNGGWIHYRIFTDEELADVIKIIAIKKSPPR